MGKYIRASTKNTLNRYNWVLKMFTSQQAETIILRLLSDFNQNFKDKTPSGIFGNFYKFPIDDGDYDEKRLIRYLFGGLKKFEVWDKPMEKINWEIPFYYKGYRGSFSHEKFGFRVYLDKKIIEKDAIKVSEEIIKIINKALKLSEPIVKDVGRLELSKGEIIINNKLHDIESEYLFFSNLSQIKEKKANIPKAFSIKTPPIKSDFKSWRESEYLADAAYIMFFSLLEHICILGLAFTQNNKVSIGEFARYKWYEKFKMIFSLEVIEFRDFYNYLHKVADNKRNPTSHGYLSKKNTIFNFYFDKAHHRIPMALYDKELLYISGDTQKVNLETLHSFLKLIRKHSKTRNMMFYLDSGLDVSYDKSTLIEYRTLMSLTQKSAKDYIENLCRNSDDMANMDW
ncbi:hypothetical protein B6D29_02270 [Microgenomates bacterium UTCPR1]|nr:MAG: hypothetical protein B6D29_02270 [Microgenomates bacterium UTCPR1]